MGSQGNSPSHTLNKIPVNTKQPIRQADEKPRGAYRYISKHRLQESPQVTSEQKKRINRASENTDHVQQYRHRAAFHWWINARQRRKRCAVENTAKRSNTGGQTIGG
jgi:hypothetical protein